MWQIFSYITSILKITSIHSLVHHIYQTIFFMGNKRCISRQLSISCTISMLKNTLIEKSVINSMSNKHSQANPVFHLRSSKTIYELHGIDTPEVVMTILLQLVGLGWVGLGWFELECWRLQTHWGPSSLLFLKRAIDGLNWKSYIVLRINKI